MAKLKAGVYAPEPHAPEYYEKDPCCADYPNCTCSEEFDDEHEHDLDQTFELDGW